MRKFSIILFHFFPPSFKRIFLMVFERYFYLKTLSKERDEALLMKSNGSRPLNPKKRILFYHVSGLSFGGTEKFLQIIAKHLSETKYEIFFMYSAKSRMEPGPSVFGEDGRKTYFENSKVNLVSFDYEYMEKTYPFRIVKMNPSIFEIIKNNNIDLLITAGSGYAEFPFNIVRNIPIILINIFGSPSTQKNIVKQICISNEVANKLSLIVPKEKIEVMYIPSEKPNDDYRMNGLKMRQKLGFQGNDIIFGRIGRADNGIYDPIGIEAFKKVVKKYSEAKYLIQSPPPILVKKVKDENIPNVSFLKPNSDESEIWSFHFAIDVLAHFRHDGESCGLNIIESMIAKKPIITHKSHIWNAHLEYLEPSFSRVAEKDNIEQYASFMEEFIDLKKTGRLEPLGQAAGQKSEMFLIDNNISRIEEWIDNLA